MTIGTRILIMDVWKLLFVCFLCVHWNSYRTIDLHDIFSFQMSRIFWECSVFITYWLTHQHVSSGLLKLNRNLQTKFVVAEIRFSEIDVWFFETLMIYSSFFSKKIIMYLFESGSKSNWNVMRMRWSHIGFKLIAYDSFKVFRFIVKELGFEA